MNGGQLLIWSAQRSMMVVVQDLPSHVSLGQPATSSGPTHRMHSLPRTQATLGRLKPLRRRPRPSSSSPPQLYPSTADALALREPQWYPSQLCPPDLEGAVPRCIIVQRGQRLQIVNRTGALFGTSIDALFNELVQPGWSILISTPLSDRLAPGVFSLFASGVEIDVWVDPVCIGIESNSNCSTPRS